MKATMRGVAFSQFALLLALAVPQAHAGNETAGADSGTDETSLGEVSVTATREARPLSETPMSVGVIKGEALRELRPTHPKDAMNRIPGVWVSNLSGEGHSTAIRQPLTTSPVYLYLEDGIPTRSTGFFNHNALYEVNVPQAGGIEVGKGPGSALYGSDAIGGTINVLTRTPPTGPEFELSGEAGSDGWARLLASGGSSHGDDAWRASVNATRSDGGSESAGYDRQAGTFRWDRALDGQATLKTVAAFSQVDQKHVGKLSRGEYEQNPRTNNIPFSYREVDAFRLSMAYERESADSLLSLTPYVRDNRMRIIPSWSVGYDPSQYDTRNQSFGLLAKYRKDFAGPMRPRLIVGVDIDYSPGSRSEDSISLERTTNALGGTTYRLNTGVAARRIYEYDVTYRGVSPYLHGEISPLERLRITAGLRYDDMQYDYDNRFNGGVAGATQGVAGAFPGNGWFGHAASARVGYSHWGPKLGATYAFDNRLSAFAGYANSFRAPSESQVFRGSREATAAKAQAAAEALLSLKPVVVDNYEIGVRGKYGDTTFELAAYHMTKEDDLVSYTDPVTSQRTVMNAGKTLHRGIELAAGFAVARDWRLDVSLSRARHTYEKWEVSGTVDYSGKEMEAAPRTLANTRLTWTPGFMNGGQLQLEWVRLGSYWLDQANTGKYAGHDLVNLRADYRLGKSLSLFGSVANLFDRKYAETASGSGAAPEYAIGAARSAILGVQAKW